MRIPRVRWTALAVFVVFIYALTAAGFDFLYAVQSAAFFLAVCVGAVLAALKYIQESQAIGLDGFVHALEGRDVKPPSLWKRIW